MNKKKKLYKNNNEFIESSILNNATFMDFLDRFRMIALSMFEWINLPSSMNSNFLEKTLYYEGKACILKDEDYGFINTKCVSSGNLSIYEEPTSLECYSFNYNKRRIVYNGLLNNDLENEQCILVKNNIDMLPTESAMQLFASRLYEAERTCDTNIKVQKFPFLILVNDKQRLTMLNLYKEYDGNRPVIFGDKDNLDESVIRSINTGAPYIADKLQEYKKEIFNEALTFLGINNIMVEKKERLINDEANSNNELINLYLQARLAPRLEACKQFNELFGFTNTDKEISVRLRSDLENIIKKAESIVNDYNEIDELRR